MKQLTFEKVCSQLKKGKDFEKILDKISALSGASILLLGIKGATGDVSAFVNMLAIKDELKNISSCILNKILENKTNECEKRMNLIKWSYSVIYYTAFFDVLDEHLPDTIREKIALSIKEKERIFQQAEIDAAKENPKEIEILFPNLVCNYSNIEDSLHSLYSSMSHGLKRFIKSLSFEEMTDEKEIAELRGYINDLPSLAIERFKAQYLYLASHFNEFYVYMQIEEFKNQELCINEIYSKIIDIGCNMDDKIDVGLDKLNNILLNIPERIQEEKVKNIVNALIETYQKEIEKPIIDTKDNEEMLKYPSVSKAFIPQSYKILEYSGHESLEKKRTWKGKDECNDMDSFWAEYYISPNSLDNLLLILGEPGGGKSLLTKILSAKMIDSNNVVIRIPLREVNVDKEIEDIICEQIQKDGDSSEPIQTFKWFAQHFEHNPITIIFDGYDEVLQATGGVYRSFLNKISKFQSFCSEKHRPIRVVVTSRETLIDKAEIPIGTVVMRLCEFNDSQREKWIEIWNSYNEEMLTKSNLKLFDLPKNNDSVDELSKQPLLLLMLAIYDANFEENVNSLTTEEGLNRTKLYNELLQRFIKRELKKGARGSEIPYEELDASEQKERINLEMKRLGIAALGMYNRCKLSLNVEELDKDLEFMEVESLTYTENGKMLSAAENLFGSFFFIHDSKSGEEHETAFEFLHKTFYEFLVADLMLKYLVKEVDSLDELRCSRTKNNYQKALENPKQLGKQFYTSLMNTYLFAEPEILQMMIEWKDNIINTYFNGECEDFDITLKELLNKHIEMICKNVFTPFVNADEAYSYGQYKSYLQYCASYSINLMIMRTITQNSSLVEIDLNIWKYISYFWKMNIQEDVLLKFTTLFSISNHETYISIEKKSRPNMIEKKSRIDQLSDISNFLQDDTMYSFCVLHDPKMTNQAKQRHRNNLKNKGINTEFEIIIGELYKFAVDRNQPFSLTRNIENGCACIKSMKIDSSLVMEWLICLNSVITPNKNKIRKVFYKTSNFLVDTILNCYENEPYIIIELFKFIDKTPLPRHYMKSEKRLIYYIEKWLQTCPDLAVILMENIDGIIRYDIIEDIYKYVIENIDKIIYNAPHSISSLIRTLDIFLDEYQINRILEYAMEISFKKYHENPQIMVDAIKLNVEYNNFDVIEKFFNYEFREHEWLHKYPELLVQLLDSLVISNNFESIQHFSYLLERDYDRIVHEYPDVAIKLAQIMVQTNYINLHEDLMRYLFRRFDIIISREPENAIDFLTIIDNKKFDCEIEQAITFALERYNFLFKKSPNAAIKLLIIAGGRRKNIEHYLKKCFSGILFNDIKVDSILLFSLLDSLSRNDMKVLGEFLVSKYAMIIVKHPHLAIKIAELYRKTAIASEFMEISQSFVDNAYIDRDYIDNLIRTWCR